MEQTPSLPKKGAAATGHSNAVVDLHVFTDAAGVPTGRISTAGWDGRVLLWDTGSDEGLIKALHVT